MTQFNEEELSLHLQNMQEKLLKLREKKEEEVKRPTGELAIMNKDVKDMESKISDCKIEHADHRVHLDEVEKKRKAAERTRAGEVEALDGATAAKKAK